MTYPTNGHIPAQAKAPVAFPARAAADDSVPWARQGSHQERATARNRRMVRSLPDWDPLPPGEILVHRHRRD